MHLPAFAEDVFVLCVSFYLRRRALVAPALFIGRAHGENMLLLILQCSTQSTRFFFRLGSWLNSTYVFIYENKQAQQICRRIKLVRSCKSFFPNNNITFSAHTLSLAHTACTSNSKQRKTNSEQRKKSDTHRKRKRKKSWHSRKRAKSVYANKQSKCYYY